MNDQESDEHPLISVLPATMKITRTNSRSVSRVSPPSNAPRTGGPSSEAIPSAPTDQAQLSNLSGYLAAAMAGSPNHLAKLGALSTAVGDGKYSVDARVVSDHIIQHSLLFSAAW